MFAFKMRLRTPGTLLKNKKIWFGLMDLVFFMDFGQNMWGGGHILPLFGSSSRTAWKIFLKFCMSIPMDTHIMHDKCAFLWSPSKGPFTWARCQIIAFFTHINELQVKNHLADFSTICMIIPTDSHIMHEKRFLGWGPSNVPVMGKKGKNAKIVFLQVTIFIENIQLIEIILYKLQFATNINI